jgi:ABC-type antimicrobial peptide transport system permease subunit
MDIATQSDGSLTLEKGGQQTLNDVLSSSLSVRRFSMEMVALFAATALLLASLGIYGTLSFLVNEQAREIAIRLALTFVGDFPPGREIGASDR